MITFTVRGLPAPQGSKRAFRNKYSGRIQQVESSKRVAPWRSDVRDAAMAALRLGEGDYWTTEHEGDTGIRDPLAGPVAVELAFRLPRPKGHFGTGRNAGALKASAPIWPAVKPDIDKLERAVLDACTGLVWTDDAQVVDLGTRKRYADGEPPGVTVRVTDLSTPFREPGDLRPQLVLPLTEQED